MQNKQVSKYPILEKNFPYKNFPVIIAAIEAHFSDLFDLAFLNEIAVADPVKLKNDPYYQLLAVCMKHAGSKPLYTVNEVAEALAVIFNGEAYDVDFPGILKKDLVFVGNASLVGDKEKPVLKGTQLGYLERIAAKIAKPAEPLSFVDMLRFVSVFVGSGKPAPRVYHLSALLVCSNLQKLLAINGSLLINLSQDSQGEPKWAALHVAKEGVRIYCESALLETEKKQLEQLVRKRFPDNKEPSIRYEGQTADGGISSGYMAIAWLKEKIGIRVWSAKRGSASTDRISLSSNFWSMREAFLHFMTESVGVTVGHQQTNINVSPYHAKHRLDHTKNRLGFYMNSRPTDLVAVADMSLLYNHDLLKVSEKLISLTDSARGNSEWLQKTICLEQAQAWLLSQVDVFRKNKKKLLKNGHLKQEENRLTFELVEDPSSRGYKLLHAYEKNRTEGNAANSLFLAVFNDAAARCSDFIVLSYPTFQLTKPEYDYILGEMEYNAFIQNFEVKGESTSLKQLQADLKPILARNRWLALNHYRPPVMGDHWQAAARAWLKYLYQHPDVLSDHPNYRPFKEAVDGMGEMGLAKLLDYLARHQPSTRSLLGEIKPPFYLGAGNKRHCQQLTDYLSQSNAYFPFSQMRIGYNQAATDDLIILLNQLNQRKQFNQIQLMDIVGDDQSITEFLTKLAGEALEQQWTAPVIIKGLSDHPVYAHLNNIILCNRRERLGRAQILAIDEVPQPETTTARKTFLPESVAGQINFELDLSQDEGPWPLGREKGTVQLQLQYQRQMQQQRQLEQKHESTQSTPLREKALQGELVSHENINDVLKTYYRTLQQEFSHLQNVDFDLQKFFRDIVNANIQPSVNPPYVIRYMTQDAAKYLLRQYVAPKPKPPAPLGGRLSFGLNTDTCEPPKGLFTHRNKDDDLVLCYDLESDKPQQPTPLTPDLDFIPPTATTWQGDFRQFDLRYYLEKPPATDITEQDLNYKAAFAALQPEAEQGDNQMSPQAALNFLLPDETSKQQFKALKLSDDESRALGQVFYRFGKGCLSRLVAEFHTLSETFPHQFEQFKRAFLQPCQDMSVLCSPAAIQTLQALRIDLSKQDNPNLLPIWWQLSELHAKAAGFERPETLWQAFQHFVTELRKEGVELNNLAAFQALNPINMLVWMSRVLTCVRLIPSGQKQDFLDQIHLHDLSHGGLPYALQYEGFKRFDTDLKLTQFWQGKPTYAPQLEDIFNWPEEAFALQVKRLLATQSDLSDYEALCRYFVETDHKIARSQLICLSLIQHGEDQETVFNTLKALEKTPETLESIANCLHNAIYQHQHAKPLVNLTAILQVIKDKPKLLDEWKTVPEDLQVVWLEAATILHQRNALNELGALTKGMQKPSDYYPENYPTNLRESIYRLVAMFGYPYGDLLNIFILE